MNDDDHQEHPQILRLRNVMNQTGMSRSFLYAAMAGEPARFPRPVKIGRASGWSAAAVDSWVRARLATGTSVES